jgi:hypothetical protein
MVWFEVMRLVRSCRGPKRKDREFIVVDELKTEDLKRLNLWAVGSGQGRSTSIFPDLLIGWTEPHP